MEINYWWIGLVVVLALVLIGWLIRRDAKDKQDFKRELTQSDTNSEENQKIKTI